MKSTLKFPKSRNNILRIDEYKPEIFIKTSSDDSKYSSNFDMKKQSI